jgi:hypothetical protein
VKALQEARKIDPLNKDAARALDAAERQVELDHPTAPATPKTTPPAPATPGAATAPTPQSSGPTSKPAMAHRLLNNDEINIIRQKELTSDDTKTKVKFDNGVVKRYLATGDHDAKAFTALSPTDQALEILSTGNAKLVVDVKIATDPGSLQDFRTKVYPILMNSCMNCHVGGRAGDFSLYPGNSTPAVYTNFYILQSYSATVDKVKYLALDRDAPDHSLVLQYGLPLKVAVPAHPPVPGWRPRFQTSEDAAYVTIADWLKNSLKVVKPEYGLYVAPSGPTSKPVEKP